MFFFYNHSQLINLDGLKTSKISLIEKIIFEKILKELFLKKNLMYKKIKKNNIKLRHLYF